MHAHIVRYSTSLWLIQNMYVRTYTRKWGRTGLHVHMCVHVALQREKGHFNLIAEIAVYAVKA